MRAIVVGLVALTVAFSVVREALVASYSGPSPQRVAAIWPDHPRVLLSQALTNIGIAAVKRQPPPPAALTDIRRASRLAPLGHEAFLVRGISAQQANDLRGAELAFLAARQRAPREGAPRYFLSDLYLRTGRSAEGLNELTTLARLLPNGSTSVAPSLAAYAATSGDVSSLKAIFRDQPELEKLVLAELVKDPANAELAMRIASRMREPDGGPSGWVKAMLRNLVQAGQLDRAYRLWALVSGEQARGILFNPSFRASKAPAPFNWTYRSDSTGFAEGDGKGGLHVLFYGREDSILAGQMLLLAPGRYRIAMTVAGNPGAMLRWSLTCLPAMTGLLELPLGASGQARLASAFTVSAGCPAQMLELKGSAGELPRQADVTVSGLTLIRDDDGR